MCFYQECLGGNLEFQTIGESPLAEQMPKEMKNAILHSSLIAGNLKIMASDMVNENGLNNGNNVSLLLNCEFEYQVHEMYHKLSEKGLKDHPLEKTFWGATFGDLTDQYGNRWLLHYQG
ncbi:glyoxalase [Pedobacter psychrophilus]|uniref:Glyoxalase n=2 Tax=Pedobacter psychrophilus TaxID=1826909 RepID=A0A179DK53_9SPHI|nr:glyoxalase [Pedobacter psychrophilus]